MELEDILIESALPLHPSLAGNPRLSVRLMVNEEFHGETPFAPETPQSGVWKMTGALKILEVGENVSMMIMANTMNGKENFALAVVETLDLSAQMKLRPNCITSILSLNSIY